MLIRTAMAAAAAALVFASAASADTPATPSTLEVLGTGSVMLTPDQASLSLSVSRLSAKSSLALSQANAATDAIVAAVKTLGIPASAIQTASVDVSHITVTVGPKGHRHKLHRYRANESLSITSPAAIVGRVIDAATHAGASAVSGPDFSFSSPTAGQAAANTAALANARAQADAAAANIGYTVTGVQSVNLDPGNDGGVPSGGVSAAATPAPARQPVSTNVHPGAEEIDATVDVIYIIAPA